MTVLPFINDCFRRIPAWPKRPPTTLKKSLLTSLTRSGPSWTPTLWPNHYFFLISLNTGDIDWTSCISYPIGPLLSDVVEALTGSNADP